MRSTARRITSAATFMVVFNLALAVEAAAQSPTGSMPAPSAMKWAPVSSFPPGAEIIVFEGPTDASVPFTVRLKYPPNYKLPAHWYPVIEHLTVITGTLHMGTGDIFDPTKTVALVPGTVSILQPRTKHFAWTREETIVQVHGVGPWVATFVDLADDPLRN